MTTHEPATKHVSDELLSELRAQASRGRDLDEPKTTLFRRPEPAPKTAASKQPAPDDVPRARLGRSRNEASAASRAVAPMSDAQERVTSEPATRLEAVAQPVHLSSIARVAREETPVLGRSMPKRRVVVPSALVALALSFGAVALLRFGMRPSQVAAAHASGSPAPSSAEQLRATNESTGSAKVNEVVSERTGAAVNTTPRDGAESSREARSESGAASEPPQRRRAVELLVTGQNADALDMYRALSRAAPDDPAYALVARVLEQDKKRCEQEGKSCVP